MWRLRLHILFAAALLLLSALEWIHSFHTRTRAWRAFREETTRTYWLDLESTAGRVEIRATCFGGTPFRRAGFTFDGACPVDGLLGFSWWCVGPSDWQFTLPWWLFTLAAAISLRSQLRRRHAFLIARAAHGLCPVCSYDLRASPLRCPECGLATA